MRVLSFFIFFFMFFFTGHKSFGQTIIHAADYGVKANSFENAAAALQKAVAVCETKDAAALLLPGGRIDIWPEGAMKRELYVSNCTDDDSLPKVKNIAFLFEDCKNFKRIGRRNYNNYQICNFSNDEHTVTTKS